MKKGASALRLAQVGTLDGSVFFLQGGKQAQSWLHLLFELSKGQRVKKRKKRRQTKRKQRGLVDPRLLFARGIRY